ncbi:DUF58 domain-containing protein [Leptolyngbya sp. AN02str]|uniref:DUF58 domain-containing protein n=1 Tax=Leptolyngbya sp. AN02str TaxID=3423363 RepID=UPI003D31C834
MIPTARFYQLLLLGTILGLVVSLYPGDLVQAPPLSVAIALMLLWDGVWLGLAWTDARRVRSHRVRVTRQSLSKLSIGRDNAIHLTVQPAEGNQFGPARDRPTVLQIRDDYPQAFTATPPQLQLALVESTPQDVRYTVFPTARGEYTWGDIWVRQRGQWGLAWHEWRISQTATAAVYPDLLGLKELSIRLTLQTSGNIRKARRSGMGTEFTELREYSTGDDPRLIDWKATARRSRLLVRVLEPEQEQTLIILLDRGRLMTAQVQGLTRFDWGMNAALSLALTGLNRGDRVGLGVFDRTMQVWVPPERGQSRLATLIERLTPLQPAMLEPDYLGAITTATSQQTRRALVVVLTDLVDETASSELLTAMGRLTPRYLSFCVLLRDPLMDARAHTIAQDVPAAYSQAVALDLLAQRRLAQAKLRQQGVLVLDAPAHHISNQLVERYLHIKARNQL